MSKRKYDFYEFRNNNNNNNNVNINEVKFNDYVYKLFNKRLIIK